MLKTGWDQSCYTTSWQTVAFQTMPFPMRLHLPADFDSVLRIDNSAHMSGTLCPVPTMWWLIPGSRKGANIINLPGSFRTTCRAMWIYDNQIRKTVPEIIGHSRLIISPIFVESTCMWCVGTHAMVTMWPCDSTKRWAPRQWLLMPSVCVKGPAGRALDHLRGFSWASSLLLIYHSFVQVNFCPCWTGAATLLTPVTQEKPELYQLLQSKLLLLHGTETLFALFISLSSQVVLKLDSLSISRPSVTYIYA